jgi:ATP-dependent RNA helicase DeaD
MSQTFETLGLIPALLETLNELGYAQPTPIQEQAIPAILSGRDVVGQAQTGTGKTAAFTLPIVQQLKGDGLQMLVLTPTRELAIQVAEAVYRYGHKLGLRVLPVYGGESYERQERRLEKGVHVVVGTPGRTLDLIKKRTLNLSNVTHVVLDEADEMLKMGFIDDVTEILSKTRVADRQTVLFSATFSDEIKAIAMNYMRNPQHITVQSNERTAEHINQRYYMVYEQDKLAALCRVLEGEDMGNTLIFARTRVGAAELAETLVERGFGAIAIHGDLAQNERERILRRFRDGTLNILVATDVVGRGIDIPDVSHVINYDLPQLAIEYTHRIGRTGRAGRSGEAISFVSPKQRRTLQEIERFTKKAMQKAKLPTREDVQKRREASFMTRLLKQIEATKDADVLLDELAESGFNAEQIMSAMLKMLRATEKQYELDHIKALNDAPERSNYGDKGRGERSYGDKPRGERAAYGGDKKRAPYDKASRDGGSRDGGASRGKRSHESGMVRLQIDLGRSNGIKPADVVYSVASTAKIPGKEIGAIEIRQNETFVDVPEKHVDAVLRAKNGTIRGQAMKLQRA